MSQEIERLNLSLRGKVDELNESESRVRMLQQEIDGFKRNAGGYENRAMQLIQEVERLNSVLKDHADKNYSLNSELEALRRK